MQKILLYNRMYRLYKIPGKNLYYVIDILGNKYNNDPVPRQLAMTLLSTLKNRSVRGGSWTGAGLLSVVAAILAGISLYGDPIASVAAAFIAFSIPLTVKAIHQLISVLRRTPLPLTSAQTERAINILHEVIPVVENPLRLREELARAAASNPHLFIENPDGSAAVAVPEL